MKSFGLEKTKSLLVFTPVMLGLCKEGCRALPPQGLRRRFKNSALLLLPVYNTIRFIVNKYVEAF